MLLFYVVPHVESHSFIMNYVIIEVRFSIVSERFTITRQTSQHRSSRLCSRSALRGDRAPRPYYRTHCHSSF